VFLSVVMSDPKVEEAPLISVLTAFASVSSEVS